MSDTIAFGPFVLDRTCRSLTRAGLTVPLGGRAIEVLVVLAQASGEIVSKDTLLDQAWPGLTVTENNLQVQISTLRKALGDGWILTVPGFGYRLALFSAALPPSETLAVPDLPSLVVLPFQNLSGGAEHDYFVDGIVEDITTALACIRSLFVIARDSAFTYKDRTIDVRQVGRALGVRYVLQGSVRLAGNRLRVTSQLVDTSSGAYIWGDRFDDMLDDVFAIQARVAEHVAGAIEPTLQQAEISRARRSLPQSLGAYDCYLLGLARLHEGTGEAARSAYRSFVRATELDPTYGAAYGLAAFSAGRMRSSGLLTRRSPEVAEGVRLAWLAVQYGRNDPTALAYAALPLSILGLSPHEAAPLIDRACTLNPNSAMAWYVSGATRNFLGDSTAAIAHFERAIRLSPVDPLLHQFLGGMSLSLNLQGRHDEAVAVAGRAVAEQPNHVATRRHLAAACALSGDLERARSAMVELLRRAPHTTIASVKEGASLLPQAYIARLADAYRRAGMPE